MNLYGIFKNIITTQDKLQSIIGNPDKLAVNKVISYLDQHCRDFINASPFLVISSANGAGHCDVSPRGDAPGFVQVIDDHHLLIPERMGNKRVDTMHNILDNPRVGLLFLIPGVRETLRINGRASLILDEEYLEKMAVNGKKPLLAICVEAEECFIQCGKAFIRSELWNTTSWLDKNALPNAAKMLAAHANLPEFTEDTMEARLEEGYIKRVY